LVDHVFKIKHLCLLRHIEHNAGARTFEVLSTNEICFLCILRLSLFNKNEMRAHLLETPRRYVKQGSEMGVCFYRGPDLVNLEG
jgi:hypothetical protein